MATYEYHFKTAAGIVRVCPAPYKLWDVYLGDRLWIPDFRTPEWAIDAVASVDFAFPEGVRFLGNSSSLGLSDNMSDWAKVRIKLDRNSPATE